VLFFSLIGGISFILHVFLACVPLRILIRLNYLLEKKKKKNLLEFFMLTFTVSYRFFGVKKYYKILFCTIDLEIYFIQ
jgi:hypothetical protein